METERKAEPIEAEKVSPIGDTSQPWATIDPVDLLPALDRQRLEARSHLERTVLLLAGYTRDELAAIVQESPAGAADATVTQCLALVEFHLAMCEMLQTVAAHVEAVLAPVQAAPAVTVN